jgi:hypothetical protein
MTKKRSLIGLGFLTTSVLAIAVVALLMLTTDVDVTSSATHQFTIKQRMPRVRKILVRTNAIKKIVAMADAELLDQEWLQLQFEIDRPILRRDWHVDGEGELVVQLNNSYLGQHDLTLKQAVDIKRDRLNARNTLQDTTGAVQDYQSELTLTPDESEMARFDCTMRIRVKTTANWLIKSIVESQIKEAAGNALQQQEEAIRQVVEDHADELIVVPGFGDE